MPLVVYNTLDLGYPIPTNMQLEMVDRSVKRLIGILYYVLVKVVSFTFLVDFDILDCEVGFEVPIILGRPFLTIERVLIDLQANELLIRLNNEVVQFNICQSMKQHKEISMLSIVDVYYEVEKEVPVEEKFVLEPVAAVLMNFDSEAIEEYEETVCALIGMGSYSYAPKNLDLDLKNCPTPPVKLSIKEPPVLEVKELLGHLRYIFLGSGNILPVITVVDLGEQ